MIKKDLGKEVCNSDKFPARIFSRVTYSPLSLLILSRILVLPPRGSIFLRFQFLSLQVASVLLLWGYIISMSVWQFNLSIYFSFKLLYFNFRSSIFYYFSNVCGHSLSSLVLYSHIEFSHLCFLTYSYSILCV